MKEHMYDIDEMLKGVKDKLREYYSTEKNIDEDQWMKDIISKMVDRLGITESTAKKNVDALTRNPENLKELSVATGLSADYLLGLSDKPHIGDLVTYEDAFRFLKKMIEDSMIYEYEAPDGNTYYRLREDLEDIILRLEKLREVIRQCHPEKPEAFKVVESAWIESEKGLFIEATSIEPDKSKDMTLALSTILKEQMSLHNIGNTDLSNKYDAFLHKNFTLNEMIGVNNISKYLNHNTTMPLKHVIGLSLYFGTTVDHFLGLDDVSEKENKAVLFDALIWMYNMNGILHSISFTEEHQYNFEIVYFKNIFRYFCKEYLLACKSSASWVNVLSDEEIAKMKELKYKQIVDGFKMPIKPIYQCDESTHKGCLMWLNTHPNGQSYADYEADYEKKCYEEFLEEHQGEGIEDFEELFFKEHQ